LAPSGNRGAVGAEGVHYPSIKGWRIKQGTSGESGARPHALSGGVGARIKQGTVAPSGREPCTGRSKIRARAQTSNLGDIQATIYAQAARGWWAGSEGGGLEVGIRRSADQPRSHMTLLQNEDGDVRSADVDSFERASPDRPGPGSA